MKKKNLLLVAILMAGSVFTACSDNKGGGGKYDGLYVEKAVVAHEYAAWSYFNFETGEVTTLPVDKVEGAVTGLFSGSLKGSGMFASMSQDSVKVMVERISADSVNVTFEKVMLSMGGKSGNPVTLAAKAKAELKEGVWTLASTESETQVESEGKTKVYKFKFNGTIGTKKGADVKLDCQIKPGAMPMYITTAYTSKVSDSYTYEVKTTDEAALKWDIAVHKYDIRTNNGQVKKLAKTDLDAVTVADIPAEGEWIADTDGKAMVDMSNMMQGFVGYQYLKLNGELGQWVTATPTGTMPPYTYTLNDNVFIVKVNGKVWKMKFNAYTYGGKTAAKFHYGEVK